ncbi:MAG: endolytic transglycosylase MltG [Porticoccaceae bacterium]|jgi:UPF0755 protein|nr:endolytic transglycosylase MltG [Porticoccaceae bacterium]
MIRTIFRIAGLFAVLLVIGALWLFSSVQSHLDAPVDLHQQSLDKQGQLIWTVPRGSNLGQINRQLFAREILSHPKIMSAYAKLTDRTSIQAGSYWISAEDSARTLLDKFNRGEVIRYQITFPEGWSFKQWLGHLATQPQFAEVTESTVAQLLSAADIDVDHPEGWFFPDTYTYTGTDSVVDILRQAHSKMKTVLDDAWEERDFGLPYNSAYEALIMASIIEKETGLAEERDAIAGVFVRRLNLGMRLQTDPTVIYGMGDSYQGNIRRSDLKRRTPYNTYRIKGLPPTPIAMPSAAAINAAVHPLSGSSLYFVARGDGGHYFSDSLEEHLRAVKQYQIKNRVQNYQSAPPTD